MAIQRGIGSIIAAIAGIVIIVLAVVLIVNITSSEPPAEDIITKTIQLRKAVQPLDRADIISDLDDVIAQADNEDIRSQWERMTKCLSSSCPDEAYLDLVLVTVAAYEGKIKQSDVLINIIATAKYWNDSEHLLEFSKALSVSNEEIGALGNRKAEKAWESVVECNGACADKHDRYFEVIELVIQ